jgi:hypothetical protein
MKCTFDFTSPSSPSGQPLTIRDYSHELYYIYAGSYYPANASRFSFSKKGEFECGADDMRPQLKLEEDFTLNYRLLVTENFRKGYDGDVTFHFFYKWAGWVYESPGTPTSPGDAGVGSLDREGQYRWAQKQDASTLESRLSSNAARLFSSPSVNSEKLSSAFADVSVIIANWASTGKFSLDDKVAASTDWATHKNWAAGQEKPPVLDNLQQKMSAAFRRLNRSQQDAFFADVSVAMARADVAGPTNQAAQSGPMVKTKKPVFAPNETIEVEYANPAGHEWDLITIARPSDGDQSSVGSGLGSKKWESYTGKERSGTKTFEGLAEGQYEARYVSWDGGNNRATARVSFTVGNAPPPPPPRTDGPTPPTTEQPPATGSSSDLSGFWVDDNSSNAVYRVRQVGNKVYWSMDATSKGEYVNVFHGEISGNMIDGEWLDMPGSPLRPALVAATLGLRIESNDRLVKVRSGNFYPAQVWTRQASASASATASGTKCAEGNPQKTVTIEVPANRAWTPTGVALNPCIQVMVEASGMIEAAAASEPRGYYHGVPPAGRGQFHADKPYQLLTTLSMVGRIGDGPVVPVGTFARWWAGPPYGSGELFLGINDDGLADNSGAWKVRITTFGAAAPASGLIQKVLPGGAQPARNREVPKVEEIPETVIKPAENTGTTNRTGNRGTVQPRVEEIPEVAVRNPASPGITNRPGNNRPRVPQVEEIPETVVTNSPSGGNVNQPDNTRKPEVEEIPEIAVKQPQVAGNTDRTRNRGTGQPQVEEIPEVAVKPSRPGTPGGRSDNTNTTSTGGGNQPRIQEPPPQRQPAGERWTLVSVTVNPETPPQGWRYNAQSPSAQFTEYQGNQAAYQWSPPPQEIDSSGFTISLGVQGRPVTNSRVAAVIGASGSGLTTDTPSDQQSANVVAETASGASAQQSVTFKPAPGASEIEVRIAMHWAVTFTYKYRRAE